MAMRVRDICVGQWELDRDLDRTLRIRFIALLN